MKSLRNDCKVGIEQYDAKRSIVYYNNTEVSTSNDEQAQYESDYVLVATPVTYNNIVDALIREKYSINDEIAILRQAQTHVDEYKSYYNYIEHCKTTAKDVLGIESSSDDIKRENYIKSLVESDSEYAIAVESFLASHGVEIAQTRKEIRNQLDALGKVIQTEDGDGSMENPYKTWKVGKEVVEGSWYLTPEHGYLWLAIKSGTPTSEIDKEYFDVVGID